MASRQPKRSSPSQADEARYRQLKAQAHPGIKAALAYLKENYADHELHLPQVAEAAYLSKFYFARLFHLAMETTFHRYLENLRIEKAKELLLTDPSLLIAQVSYRVGYNEQTTLDRVFKHQTGRTPSEWKKEQLLLNIRQGKSKKEQVSMRRNESERVSKIN